MNPLITTIIPTFRRPKLLKRAIQSVLNQSFSDFQICVYDNASGDETGEVVAAFASKDPRVKYYCHKENIGAGENFQYGLSSVNTPYFSFLADDDVLLPEFYETTLKGFEKYPDAAVSAGAVIHIEDSGEIVNVILSKWGEQEYYPPPQGVIEMIGKYSNWTGSLFKSELVSQIGSLDLGIKAMDTDYSFRIAARFPLVISKKPVALFISHSGSYSKYCGLKLIWPGWLKMISNLQKEQGLSPENKILLEKKLLENMSSLLFRAVLRCLENKDYSQARDALEIFAQYHTKKFPRQTLRIAIISCEASKSIQYSLRLLMRLARFGKRHIKENKTKQQYKQIVSNFMSIL